MNGNISDNIIELKNVKKVYRMGRERICAVDDVSFTIKKGEFCCLYGVSGSGKSTLLNLMAGIEKITSGQIVIKGNVVNRMGEKGLAKFRQNNIGFVFQSYNLMNTMTALENVELPLIFKHVGPRKRKRMAKEMLIKVGLGKRLRHKPKEMSGGQQQRVGIARAFVSNPEIVFADEPTGNLDSKTSKEVMDLIKEMAKTNQQTIVMVTHDRRLAEYADRIIHIFDGMIEEIEIIKKEEVMTEETAQEAVKGVEQSTGSLSESEADVKREKTAEADSDQAISASDPAPDEELVADVS